MATLPTFTKAIDNQFVETWYDIKAAAIDNILLATPIYALLKQKGCMTTQVGGKNVEETVKYGVGPTPAAIVKGDTLTQGEIETETAAFWTFRNVATHVQRSIIQDAENNGKYKIKDYVSKRLTEANDALKQKYETDLFNVGVTTKTDESGKELQSLNEMLPSYTNRASGTYGGIARSNSWWQSIYKAYTAPAEVNLLSDMKTLYNSIGLNQEYPDFIVCTQTAFEIYEEFALDQVQIIKDATTYLADLGFEVLRFKGKPLFWTPNFISSTTTTSLMMLNSKYIKFVYDPNLWFDMSEWKSIPLQNERIAHIVSRACMYTNQPRRHGRLYTNAADGS